MTKVEASDCPFGWSSSRDEMCLKAFEDTLTWEEAFNFCKGKEGRLASIKNSKVNAPVKAIATNWYPWLGGKKEKSAFLWSDGSPFNFTNWDDDPGSKTCVTLRTTTGRWSVYYVV